MNANHVVYPSATIARREPAVQRVPGTSRPSGLEALVGAGLRYLVSLPRRQAIRSELARLSDRELADIGLTRSEIASVFTR